MKGRCSKRYIMLSVLAVHRLLNNLICIYLQTWPIVIMTVVLSQQILLWTHIYTGYFPLPPPPFNIGNSMQVAYTHYYILHQLFLILGTQGKCSIGYKTYVKSGNGASQNQHRAWAVLILTKQNSLYSRYINPIPKWARIWHMTPKKYAKMIY